jgi:organic hydroperoxide reductase OsmC/OhrA
VSHYSVAVSWERGDAAFLDRRYSRAHTWKFDGGMVIRGSSSPDVVPVPYSDPSAVDPEEAFVAALSSCHMLCFLAIAAKRGFAVHTYEDNAIGTLAPGERGRACIATVRLQPHVVFQGRAPTLEVFDEMHHEAHEECYIANSVTTRLTTAGSFDVL